MEGKKTHADLIYAYVFSKIRHIDATLNVPATKALLANMRRGMGRVPGDEPELWGMLFSGIPEELENRGRNASKEEWAIYLTLTLYALHMQGSGSSVCQAGNTLGKAVAQLAVQGSEEAVNRRFNALATSADISELGWHLRGMITLLKSKGIALDYPRLAQELYRYQYLEQTPSVRLQWGRDYYSAYDKLMNKGKKEENHEE